MKKKQSGKWPKYFIPASMMDEQHKDFYNDRLIEEPDAESMEIEDVLGDISNESSLDELSAARLDNLKARTALIEQKLEEQKKALFSEWSESFFEVFCESFGKYKNKLINLHLNKEQIKELNESLEYALKCMSDKLIEIWSDFNKEEDNNEEKK